MDGVTERSTSTFVLIHGSWSGHIIWQYLSNILTAAGNRVIAVDLPGCGVYYSPPAAYMDPPSAQRCLTLSTAPSEAAKVSQQQRTDAVVQAVMEAGCRVILVAHSSGGVTATAVAEAIPHLVSGLVYVTSFMLPAGMSAMSFKAMRVMQGHDALRPFFIADPKVIGALRVDPRSIDPAYMAAVKKTFGEDVDAERWAALQPHLYSDEPVSKFVVLSTATATRYGTIPRYFVKCTRDAIMLEKGQDWMIQHMDATMADATVDAGVPVVQSTVVFSLDACHSVMLSQPEALADILQKVALATEAGQTHKQNHITDTAAAL